MEQVRPGGIRWDPGIPAPIPIPIPIPLLLFQPHSKRPLPCVERGSQMSPKLLKLECDPEAGPSHPRSCWEFQTEPGPSGRAGAGDAGGDRECHRPCCPDIPHPMGAILACPIPWEPWPRVGMVRIHGVRDPCGGSMG